MTRPAPEGFRATPREPVRALLVIGRGTTRCGSDSRRSSRPWRARAAGIPPASCEMIFRPAIRSPALSESRLLQAAKIHPRLVFKLCAIVDCVCVEDFAQVTQHWLILCIAGCRDIRGRQQPAFDPRVVELLNVRKQALLKPKRIEEFVHSGPFMPHFFIVRAES